MKCILLKINYFEKANKQNPPFETHYIHIYIWRPQCEISMENRQAGNNEMTSPEPTYKELSNTVKL